MGGPARFHAAEETENINAVNDYINRRLWQRKVLVSSQNGIQQLLYLMRETRLLKFTHFVNLSWSFDTIVNIYNTISARYPLDRYKDIQVYTAVQGFDGDLLVENPRFDSS